MLPISDLSMISDNPDMYMDDESYLAASATSQRRSPVRNDEAWLIGLGVVCGLLVVAAGAWYRDDGHAAARPEADCPGTPSGTASSDDWRPGRDWPDGRRRRHTSTPSG